MRELWWPLALAAAFIVTAAAGAATAQTVIVTKAPPGAAVEVGLDTTTIATATADGTGLATLTVDLSAHGGKSETDVRIFVDVCQQTRRVTLVETGYQPSQAAPGCTRREIFGVFYLQKVTTLVVNAAEDSQAVWIRQGPAPGHWLSNEAAGGSAETGSALRVPTGFSLFGGGGVGKYANAVSVSCGTGPQCTGNDVRLAGRVGGDFWFTPYVAASASYLRPASAPTAGAGTDYTFTSSQSLNVATMTAKVGVPFRSFRLYGEGGATYTWGTLTTKETTNDRTVTINGVPQTVPGGTQTFELKTGGWGWTIGGGLEMWVKHSIALYAEFGRAKLGGKAVGGGEGSLDETLTYAVAGVRLHLGGRR